MIKLNLSSDFKSLGLIGKELYYIPCIEIYSNYINILKGEIQIYDDLTSSIHFVVSEEVKYQILWQNKIFYETKEEAKKDYIKRLNEERLITLKKYKKIIEEKENYIKSLIELMTETDVGIDILEKYVNN